MTLQQSIAEECVDFALFLGISPHYLLAVGQQRSGLTDTNKGGLFGPFRLSQSDWDANRSDQEFGLTFNFTSEQITSWRRTCDVFALMTYRAEKALQAKLQRFPSVIELYSAQFPAAITKTLEADLKAALDATAPLIAPATATLDDPSESGGVVAAPTTPLAPTPLSPTPVESSFGTGPFKSKAPRIMRSLIADFQLRPFQAAGVLGNLGHETGGFRFFHELGKPFDQGGIGWAQWTGARRKAFETFCTKNKLDIMSDEGSFRFLEFELTSTSEKQVLGPLKRTLDIADAVKTFSTIYERAGVAASASRLSFANIAFRAFNAQVIPA